jgi:hypothetical protein
MTVVSLLEAILEDVVEHGDEVGARCPQHPHHERRPRHFSVNQAKGVFLCRSCGYSGRLEKLVMDVAELDPRQARQLIQIYDAGPESREERNDGPGSNGSHGRAGSDSRPEDDEDLAAQVLREFEHFGEPHAHALKARHISAAVCRRFDVRWNGESRRIHEVGPEAWVILVRSFANVVSGWQVKRSLSDGVCIDEKGPDVGGNAVYCRDGTRLGQSLFGLDHYPRVDQLWLVESPLDVVYLSEQGIAAVGSYGINVNNQQLEQIRHCTPCLVLALDNDDKGREKTEQILRTSNIFDLRFERLQVLNYGLTDADDPVKDPGDMRRRDLEVALEWAHDVQLANRKS